MSDKLIDENDTVPEMIEKIGESFFINGPQYTANKLKEEVKNILDVRIDSEKIKKEVIDECLKKREPVNGEGHEYIFRIKNGVREFKEVTGMNREAIETFWDTIDKEDKTKIDV